MRPPSRGAVTERAVGEHVGVAVMALGDDHDADLVSGLVLLAAGAGRIHGDHDLAATLSINWVRQL